MNNVPEELLLEILSRLPEPALVDMDLLSSSSTRCTRTWFRDDLLESIVDHDRRRHRRLTKDLHACALVSKRWARISLPLLWRKPFLGTDHQARLLHDVLAEENDPYVLFPYRSWVKELHISDLSLYSAFQIGRVMISSDDWMRNEELEGFEGGRVGRSVVQAIHFAQGTAAAINLTHTNFFQLLSNFRPAAEPLDSSPDRGPESSGIQALTLGTTFDSVAEVGAMSILHSFPDLFKNIERLDLGFATWVGDNVLRAIRELCPKLCILDIGSDYFLHRNRNDGLSSEGFTTFFTPSPGSPPTSPPSSLTVLSLASRSIRSVNPTTFAVLAASCGPTLQGLSLAGCEGVNDIVCASLRSSFPRLHSLDVSACPSISPAGWYDLLHLAHAGNLRHLQMADAKLDDAATARLCASPGMSRLHYLDISESNTRIIEGEGVNEADDVTADPTQELALNTSSWLRARRRRTYGLESCIVDALCSNAHALCILAAARWAEDEARSCAVAVEALAQNLRGLTHVYHGLDADEATIRAGAASSALTEEGKTFARKECSRIAEAACVSEEMSTGWVRTRMLRPAP
ncbi:hypothetical protein HDU96_010606 [Phlyctochytrium bullatum]|nr:hypothetical protein HDU96_010606 [Phlyctochytrium bullatum]